MIVGITPEFQRKAKRLTSFSDRFAVKKGLKHSPQFILREVATGEFRNAQFDFTGDLPSGRVRFCGKSPSLVVKPISKLLKRNCIAQVSR
jgi:hypothetical protein